MAHQSSNTTHLFGFFSMINPDAIKDVTLYKGGYLPHMASGSLR